MNEITQIPDFISIEECFAAIGLLENNPDDTFAMEIVSKFIIREFAIENKKFFTDEEFLERYHILCFDKVINNLIDRGLLTEEIGDDGEIYYSSTNNDFDIKSII